MSRIQHRPPWQPQRLVELQLGLECIAVGPDNVLVRIPCAKPDEIARFLVTTYAGTYHLYFRADLPHDIRQALERLAPQQACEDPGAVYDILSQDRPCDQHATFHCYVFRQALHPELYRAVLRLPDQNTLGGPMFGIVVDGQVVAACTSARENGTCAEAWVWTRPEFQRRGYASQVAMAWAHDLQLQGKVPFYSHAVSNVASAGVARRLGLMHVAVITAYS